MPLPKAREPGTASTRVRRAVGWIMLLALCFAGFGRHAVAGHVDDTTVTLLSHRYYSAWDLTRLKYHIKTDHRARRPTCWVLELADCVTEDMVLWWASSWYTWVEEPFRGVRFEISSDNEIQYLWLVGQWDVGDVEFALGYSNRGRTTYATGTIDGPVCGGSSIAIEIVRGESVSFPPVLQAGRLDAEDTTTLRVTSSSSGWSLDRTLLFDVPSGAQEDVVRSVFDVEIGPYAKSAGATDVEISYAIDIGEEDLAGLPEGSYVIGVAYTVTLDD